VFPRVTTVNINKDACQYLQILESYCHRGHCRHRAVQKFNVSKVAFVLLATVMQDGFTLLCGLKKLIRRAANRISKILLLFAGSMPYPCRCCAAWQY